MGRLKTRPRRIKEGIEQVYIDNGIVKNWYPLTPSEKEKKEEEKIAKKEQKWKNKEKKEEEKIAKKEQEWKNRLNKPSYQKWLQQFPKETLELIIISKNGKEQEVIVQEYYKKKYEFSEPCSRHVNKADVEKNNLTLKKGTFREDGFMFNGYYRHKPYKDAPIYESWLSLNAKLVKDKTRAKNANKIRISKTTFAQRVKLRYGCKKCGYKKCATSLHFDHVDPKQKQQTISQMVGGYAMKAIKKEMRKCRILCANCHGEHTEQQFKEGVFD